MKEKVEKVLEEEVRPVLRMHGGGVEVVEVTDEGVVKVKLTGGCAGCPFSMMTTVGVVENTLKSKIPEVKGVELIR
ncbi:NifU family protein [Candidatus Calescamantes bacterium]|nr:NifU family protein [Candidatus Calescamantes bacterium]